MEIKNIPVPAVYKEESSDFRFFLKWFEVALSKIQYDTEEFFDLYDPLRCRSDLLWMLGDTMGYVYDSRVSAAFNRLVLVYFMSIIRLKGSKDGVTLAAQLNLNQFKLKKLAEDKPILNDRLEDTSIPSNSIYVQPHPEEGYIDLVYFSDELPIDVCTEYSRPLGMYMIPHVGVRYDAKSKLSIDARLTNRKDVGISVGSTHVGHYSIDDYSRFQRLQLSDLQGNVVKDTESRTRKERQENSERENLSDTRDPVWYRNSKYEVSPDSEINPGYRALYSLQLINGDDLVSSVTHGLNAFHLSPNDVSVYDPNTNQTYDQEYYQSQRSSRGLKSSAYVEPNIMGTLGDAMNVQSLETSK